MHITPIDTASGIAIVPAAVEHAAALASLVRQNIGHLRAYLPAVASLCSDEAVHAHLLGDAERALAGDALEWHLFVDGMLCGAVRLKDIDMDDRKAKIGYFLGQRFTGKGIATRAVSAVLAQGFGHLNLNRIELRCASGNTASARVAQRLGFVREGMLRQDEYLDGVFVDQLVFGLLAAEFKAASYKENYK